jgi:hypothetical protein
MLEEGELSVRLREMVNELQIHAQLDQTEFDRLPCVRICAEEGTWECRCESQLTNHHHAEIPRICGECRDRD